MVVGPQQHWLHINQHHFVAWSFTGVTRRTKKQAAVAGFSTPPRAILGDIHENTTEAKVQEKGENANTLPAPTPGQPRKAPSPRRTVSKPPRIASLTGARTVSVSENSENIPEDELALSSSASASRKSSASYGNIGVGRSIANKIAGSTASPRRKSSREVGTPRSASTSSTGGGVRKVSKAKGRA